MKKCEYPNIDEEIAVGLVSLEYSIDKHKKYKFYSNFILIL